MCDNVAGGSWDPYVHTTVILFQCCFMLEIVATKLVTKDLNSYLSLTVAS